MLLMFSFYVVFGKIYGTHCTGSNCCFYPFLLFAGSPTFFNILKMITLRHTRKKMFNQDEEKMECAVGNREMGFWQGKKIEIVLISFLTS